MNEMYGLHIQIFPETELDRICHEIAYGDDSKETWIRYCELMNIQGTEEDLENMREEYFDY
jgi:hypothetical protein